MHIAPNEAALNFKFCVITILEKHNKIQILKILKQAENIRKYIISIQPNKN